MDNEWVMLVIEGKITPGDKAASDYYYVPFDVPSRITRLDVRYEYSHPRHHGDFAGQGNTIDIGLFDPHGYEFLNADGFRGWSGSDRAEIFVGEHEATPGYLAGPIHPGRWHVILGLYRVAPEGCDYRVTIEMTARPDPTPPTPSPLSCRYCATGEGRGGEGGEG